MMRVKGTKPDELANGRDKPREKGEVRETRESLERDTISKGER
jgi:hypothetical protein